MSCLDASFPCEVSESCPAHGAEVAYHTEIIVDGELHIPEVKPPSEKIINITRRICLTKVVKIPVKLDNGCVAGCKLLVVGKIRLGFEYSACVPEQNVHFVHFDVPFQALITGNPCHKPIPLCDCNFKKFDLHVCVEHIQAELVEPRSIEKVVVLLLWLSRKGREHSNPCRYDHEHDCNINCCGHEHEYECISEPFESEGEADCNSHYCDQESEVSKQISINRTLCIPPQKPPAECILSSAVDIDINKAELIATPLTDHCHRPIMKVVVTGKAEITVKYAADVPNQQVHAAVFRVPFEALIEWPGGPPQHTPVCVTVTVEHFQIDLLDHRRLFLVLILRLDVNKK